MSNLKILTALAFSFFCTSAQLIFSQKIQQKYFTVYLNNSENNCAIQAQVATKKTKIRYSDTLKYYWYYIDKIIITQGASDGKILHGKYATFYYNKNLKEKGVFKKGLKNGHWMKWDDKGILQEMTNWHNGYRQGKQTLFDSVGIKKQEATYSKGKLNGRFFTYSNGKIATEKKFKKGTEVLPKEKEEHSVKENKARIAWDKIKNKLKLKAKETAPDKKIKTKKKSTSTEKKAEKKKFNLFNKSASPANTTNANQPK